MIEFAILFSLMLALGMFAFRTSWVQVAFLPALIILAYVSLFELPGRGKDIKYEFFLLNEEARVISTVMEEDVAIHLWLEIDDKPRYFFVDWEDETAKDMLKKMNKQRGQAEEGNMLNLTVKRSEAEFDNRLTFHTRPVPQDPPKENLDETIIIE